MKMVVLLARRKCVRGPETALGEDLTNGDNYFQFIEKGAVKFIQICF